MFTVHDLPRATPGSAGLDLAASKDMIFSQTEGVVLIPTSVKGTLPEGVTGLLIGRSSNYKKGLEVLPGVINSDFSGEIKVMTKATKETVIVRKGERIAQILLLPYLKLSGPELMADRGQGQFGSSDAVAWVAEIGQQRPMMTVKLNGRSFKGLLDTGADKTCIAGKDWPQHWPIQQTSASLQGLGMATGVARSAETLHWTCDGKKGIIHPYVIPTLPFTLWGRDIMGAMSVKLMTEEKAQDFS